MPRAKATTGEAQGKISEDGRRLLREAAVAEGLPSDVGNRIADRLDSTEHANVSIEGKTPDEAGLRVFGTAQSTPGINVEPLDEGEQPEQQEDNANGPLAEEGIVGEQPNTDPDHANGPHIDNAEDTDEDTDEDEDASDLSDLSKDELVEAAKEAGVPTSGTKADLIERLGGSEGDEGEADKDEGEDNASTDEGGTDSEEDAADEGALP